MTSAGRSGCTNFHGAPFGQGRCINRHFHLPCYLTLPSYDFNLRELRHRFFLASGLASQARPEWRVVLGPLRLVCLRTSDLQGAYSGRIIFIEKWFSISAICAGGLVWRVSSALRRDLTDEEYRESFSLFYLRYRHPAIGTFARQWFLKTSVYRTFFFLSSYFQSFHRTYVLSQNVCAYVALLHAEF
jgi:hypothetical protein